MNILLVEDELRLAEALGHLLSLQGYKVDTAHTVAMGESYAFSCSYDVIILDRMLPDQDGMALLHTLRQHSILSPVLFLTAKDKISDKICGLDSGADDYLVKPFDNTELLARIRALSRRPQALSLGKVLKAGLIRLDMQELKAYCNEVEVKLTPKETQLLELLLRNKNQILPKELIFTKIWGFEQETEISIVELYMFYLRKKIAFSQCHVELETIRGVGYRLKESQNERY